MTYQLSYGECAAIENEWGRFKEEKGVAVSDDAMLAMEFIDTECKGVYDTEEERSAVFDCIGCLEE